MAANPGTIACGVWSDLQFETLQSVHSVHSIKYEMKFLLLLCSF